MMVFPQVWDWYLTWRERRRGFYTKWEVDLLSIAAAFCREETGWLRQTPRIADNLHEIDGLISDQDIATIHADWAGACERMYSRDGRGACPNGGSFRCFGSRIAARRRAFTITRAALPVCAFLRQASEERRCAAALTAPKSNPGCAASGHYRS